MVVRKLSSEDVKEQKFSTSRMKGGYSAEEVDEFVASTQETLESFEKEIADLRTIKSADVLEQLKEDLEITKARNEELETAASARKRIADEKEEAANKKRVEAEREMNLYKKKVSTQREELESLKKDMMSGDNPYASRLVVMAQENYVEIIEKAYEKADGILQTAQEELRKEHGPLMEERDNLLRSIVHLAQIDQDNRDRLAQFYDDQVQELQSIPSVDLSRAASAVGISEDSMVSRYAEGMEAQETISDEYYDDASGSPYYEAPESDFEEPGVQDQGDDGTGAIGGQYAVDSVVEGSGGEYEYGLDADGAMVDYEEPPVDQQGVFSYDNDQQLSSEVSDAPGIADDGEYVVPEHAEGVEGDSADTEDIGATEDEDSAEESEENVVSPPQQSSGQAPRFPNFFGNQ